MGDLGSIPGLGRPPGEGKGYPLQYSGLEKSMGCIVHGVTKSGQDGATNAHIRAVINLVAQLVKNPPAMQETQVQFLVIELDSTCHN